MAKANKSFEESVGRLEEIVRMLENGTATLDESLKLYEEGIRLASRCATELEAAKRKIQILQRNADGEIVVADIPEENLSKDGEAE